MLMGDILAAARRSAGGFEQWLRGADPALAADFTAAAVADDTTQASWLRMAIADFERFASEEDWATLVSQLRDDADPGSKCLLAMLKWRLVATRPQTAIPFTSDEEVPDERNVEITRS